MKEHFIKPICPVCGELEPNSRSKCPFHLIIHENKFYGCPICYSPVILGRINVCSNPACSGWEKSADDTIAYRGRLVFVIYPGTDNIYYIYDAPNIIGFVKLFYQQLYYKVVEELHIPKKDYMYIF